LHSEQEERTGGVFVLLKRPEKGGGRGPLIAADQKGRIGDETSTSRESCSSAGDYSGGETANRDVVSRGFGAIEGGAAEFVIVRDQKEGGSGASVRRTASREATVEKKKKLNSREGERARPLRSPWTDRGKKLAKSGNSNKRLNHWSPLTSIYFRRLS